MLLEWQFKDGLKQTNVYSIKKLQELRTFVSLPVAKLYIPSILNIDLILWHTQLIVCADNVKSWFKSWGFPFTFPKAYTLPCTLNCIPYSREH